mmetsp:Transcript_13253/g.38197  ORF Transcript_13253/g.38197 Transcript_13253/m.38197 type:complete len:233 (-) Transcript_13253:142-840(-)
MGASPPKVSPSEPSLPWLAPGGDELLGLGGERMLGLVFTPISRVSGPRHSRARSRPYCWGVMRREMSWRVPCQHALCVLLPSATSVSLSEPASPAEEGARLMRESSNSVEPSRYRCTHFCRSQSKLSTGSLQTPCRNSLSLPTKRRKAGTFLKLTYSKPPEPEAAEDSLRISSSLSVDGRKTILSGNSSSDGTPTSLNIGSRMPGDSPSGKPWHLAARRQIDSQASWSAEAS